MKLVKYAAYALLIIGGLNWGSIGLFDKNLVNMFLGQWPIVEKVIYILVGAAAVCKAVCCLRCCTSHSDSNSCCHHESK